MLFDEGGIDMTHDMLVESIRLEFGDDPDEMDIESAIYYFTELYHGGQGSDLYEILCNSEYTPGPMEVYEGWADECVMGSLIYEFLVDRYGEDI
jgi:hypothetical protein